LQKPNRILLKKYKTLSSDTELRSNSQCLQPQPFACVGTGETPVPPFEGEVV
jgi:hypothetical protein